MSPTSAWPGAGSMNGPWLRPGQQVWELNEDGNTAAENILTEEADLAGNSMIYFIAILNGEDPRAEEEEKAKEE